MRRIPQKFIGLSSTQPARDLEIGDNHRHWALFDSDGHLSQRILVLFARCNVPKGPYSAVVVTIFSEDWC